jgi:hypothetical protein
MSLVAGGDAGVMFRCAEDFVCSDDNDSEN